MKTYPYYYFWGNNKERKKYQYAHCRIIARDRKMNTCLVEFEDGHKMTTSRNAVRKG